MRCVHTHTCRGTHKKGSSCHVSKKGKERRQKEGEKINGEKDLRRKDEYAISDQ
jgi:hypothetical protein